GVHGDPGSGAYGLLLVAGLVAFLRNGTAASCRRLKSTSSYVERTVRSAVNHSGQSLSSGKLGKIFRCHFSRWTVRAVWSSVIPEKYASPTCLYKSSRKPA